MGLFKRAYSIRKSAPKRIGLLQKSRKFIEPEFQKTKTDSYTHIDQKERDRADQSEESNIFNDISKLQDGIEAPAHLFSIIKENLHLSRAALLLYDPIRMFFAPWASVGYDKTTNHRLRIPLGYNKTFNRVANGDVFLLSRDQDLDEFKRCFSSREFSALTQLLFVPFIFNGKLIAVLLITQMEGSLSEEDLTLFHEISKRAAPVIFRAREEKLKNIKQESLQMPESLEDKAHTLAQACYERGIPFMMIKFSLEDTIQNIMKHNPFLDSFRLKEDIYRIIYSLFINIGQVYNLNQKHILLFVYGMRKADSQLLIHHLGHSLKNFFRELANEQILNFNEEVKISTGDGEKVLELLSELV